MTYIFSGSKFWRLNDELGRLDVGYPKSMRRWHGIPHNLDAATSLRNGEYSKILFYKNLYIKIQNCKHVFIYLKFF